MEWKDAITLKGKEYKFEEIADEPLTFIMKVDESYHLQRDIDCDMPLERITLIKKYKSTQNGVTKDDKFVDQVYHGKEIKSVEFMTNLLEHALHGIIDELKYN